MITVKEYKTHRCEELINHNNANTWQKVCIRAIINPDEVDKHLHYDKWTLYYLETDSEDWDNKHMTPICEIKICPYCGEALE